MIRKRTRMVFLCRYTYIVKIVRGKHIAEIVNGDSS